MNMRVHWHLGYVNKTACGILSYATKWPDEFDTAANNRIECSKEQKHVTCRRCAKVMLIGDFATTPAG